jgi:hypothetical protein
LVEAVFVSPKQFWELSELLSLPLVHLPSTHHLFQKTVDVFCLMGELLKQQEPAADASLSLPLFFDYAYPKLQTALKKEATKRLAIMQILVSFASPPSFFALLRRVQQSLDQDMDLLLFSIAPISSLLLEETKAYLIEQRESRDEGEEGAAVKEMYLPLLDILAYYCKMGLQSVNMKLRNASLVLFQHLIRENASLTSLQAFEMDRDSNAARNYEKILRQARPFISQFVDETMPLLVALFQANSNYEVKVRIVDICGFVLRDEMLLQQSSKDFCYQLLDRTLKPENASMWVKLASLSASVKVLGSNTSQSLQFPTRFCQTFLTLSSLEVRNYLLHFESSPLFSQGVDEEEGGKEQQEDALFEIDLHPLLPLPSPLAPLPSPTYPLLITNMSFYWKPLLIFQTFVSYLLSLEDKEGEELLDILPLDTTKSVAIEAALTTLFDCLASQKELFLMRLDEFEDEEDRSRAFFFPHKHLQEENGWKDPVLAISDFLLLQIASNEDTGTAALSVLQVLLHETDFESDILFKEGEGLLLSALRIAYPPSLDTHNDLVQQAFERLLVLLLDHPNEAIQTSTNNVLDEFARNFSAIYDRTRLSSLRN